MFLSGMITHGDFMLTLVLLFSLVLSFVCFGLFLFASYSTVSYFPYYVHIVVFISMLYKAFKMSTLFLSFRVQTHLMSPLFLSTKSCTHILNHCHKFKHVCRSRSILYFKQTNKDVICCRTKIPEIYSKQILNIVGSCHNMGNLICYSIFYLILQ